MTQQTNEEIEIVVPKAPQELFQYESNEKAIINEGTPTYMLDHIDYSDGVKAYLKGAQFPQKGFPTPDIMNACNQVKKILAELFKHIKDPMFYTSYIYFLLSFNKIYRIERFIESFNGICFKVMRPYLLQPKFMTPIGLEIKLILKSFLTKLGINEEQAIRTSDIFSHLLDYDNGYRFRVQDILSESSKEKMLKNPRKEIKRLVAIYCKRERSRIEYKFKGIAFLLNLLLLIPRYKRIFKEVIRDCNFERLQYDESDIYWTCFRSGYYFLGMNYNERQKYLDDKGWIKPQAYIITVK
jgi:hypothetical protein